MHAAHTPQNDPAGEYRALSEAAGFCRSAGATLIEITGADRTTFLHNLCTADIRSLATGEGCELFLTDVKGKTIGHGLALAGPDSIVLSTVPKEAEKLLSHLDRYLIREDVQLENRSEDWQQWILYGPDAAEICRNSLDREVPTQLFGHLDAALGAEHINICRTDFYGPNGFLLRLSGSAGSDLYEVLHNSATECGVEIFDALRIEAGTPLFGVDICKDNFPQEIDRDARAISFTKGCYLGQETVARIDALGRVNRLLRSLKFSGERVPLAGTPLQAEGDTAGQVTSAALSPRDRCPRALALLGRDHCKSGERLESEFGSAEVL